MEELVLQAKPRQAQGKGSSRRLRKSGMVPAIVYGEGKDPLPLSVRSGELEKSVKSAGENAIIRLSIPEGTPETAMVRQKQYDPLEGSLLHIDLLRINLTQKVTAKVTVRPVNEADGIKEGGILEHHLWEVTVESLPRQIPEAIETDVSSLQIGESIHVRDLSVPEGVEILDDDAELVVSVVPPTVVEEEAPAPSEEEEKGAEPEVITEKKEEKGEGEAKKE